jgi:uncharacterized protein (TIGR02246 family)
MSEARDVLDRLTAAMVAKDAQTVAECYAEDAVAVTPDEGELRGRDPYRGVHDAIQRFISRSSVQVLAETRRR